MHKPRKNKFRGGKYRGWGPRNFGQRPEKSSRSFGHGSIEAGKLRKTSAKVGLKMRAINGKTREKTRKEGKSNIEKLAFIIYISEVKSVNLVVLQNRYMLHAL